MSRSQGTVSLGVKLTLDYRDSGLTVDAFIDSMEDAFDKRHLHQLNCGDKYAYFHLVKDGMVFTYYYYQSRDEWFCKF